MYRMIPCLLKKVLMHIFVEKAKIINMQGQDLGCKYGTFTFNFINFYIIILL